MKKITILFLGVYATFGAAFSQKTPPAPHGAVPNAIQMYYLHQQLAGFVHYGMNTYTGKDGIEWGNERKEPASSFNPTARKVDTDQWVRLFKKAGFKRIILVMKHHDGFCTWHTQQTDYNISNSPYQNGKGDLAKELSESCDKYGMDMGVYLSPWDAHEPSYGDNTPGDYNEMYNNQLRELLGGKYGRTNPKTGKREIVEVWLDGATGTANKQTYDLNRFYKTVRELQPNCCVWMDAKWHTDQNGVRTNFNLDAMWVGNEAGYINDPAWNTIVLSKLKNGEQGRVANGDIYSVSEADVSIRPGWFYHSAQDGSVKSLEHLMDGIYFRSVGMGIPLLLNVPPDRSGRFHANDSVALMNFGKTVENTFSKNLLVKNAKANATEYRHRKFSASNAIDNKYDTYWTMTDGQTTGSITIELKKPREFDVVKIQEYIPLGQRVSSFTVDVFSGGEWHEFGHGQTIGYQRFIKSELVKASKLRVNITGALAVPLINEIGIYRYAPAVDSSAKDTKNISVFEFSEKQTAVGEAVGSCFFEVKRSGNINSVSEITVITTPGTGVHGKTYEDTTLRLRFQAGETVKRGEVKIIDNHHQEGDKDFYIELSNPPKNAVIGGKRAVKVSVKEND